MILFVGILWTFSFGMIEQACRWVDGQRGGSATYQRNSPLLWLLVILILGIFHQGTALLTLPQNLPRGQVLEIVGILLLLRLFSVKSNYKIQKTLEHRVRFVLLFPLGEEILFRGVLQRAFYEELTFGSTLFSTGLLGHVPGAVILSALLFALTHLQYNGYRFSKTTWIQMAFALVFGLYAGKLAYGTGSLLLPLLLHMAANGMRAYYDSQKTLETA